MQKCTIQTIKITGMIWYKLKVVGLNEMMFFPTKTQAVDWATENDYEVI